MWEEWQFYSNQSSNQLIQSFSLFRPLINQSKHYNQHNILLQLYIFHIWHHCICYYSLYFRFHLLIKEMGEHNFYFALVIYVLIISRKSLQMLICFVKIQKYHVRIVSFLIYPYPLDFFCPCKEMPGKRYSIKKRIVV